MTQETEVKKSMQGVIDFLKEELKNIRTGRANPALLDNVLVDVYGAKMKIRDLANITVPESRQLLITPYDTNNVNSIAKGIEVANLNLQPQVDGNVVRINIPPMDESIRKDMVKRCKEKTETAKVKVREVRRKFNEVVRKQKTDGEIPEDFMKKEEKMIQDLTDHYCKDLDGICSEKEKEILEV